MAGAVVENLSNRKLFYILLFLVAAQIVFFLLGGLIAPKPSTAMPFLMTKCYDPNGGGKDDWFYLRPRAKDGSNCIKLDDLGPHASAYDIHDARHIVFVAQMPHMRENVALEYSPWFQTLLGLLIVESEYTVSGEFATANNPDIRLEVRMGYRTRNDLPTTWHELTSTTVSRRMSCEEPVTKKDGYHYSCEPVDLFELGSSDYPFYLLNIRLPGCNASAGRYNCDIGKISDLSVIEIHQNGGFTKVWLSMKTLLTPFVFAAVLWYWNRIRLLPRKPYLLEKSLLTLGATMVFLDFPVEWMSLWVRMPFMLLLSDIRQGVFYAALFCFWLIFTGEHLMDDSGKNRLTAYWKHLSAVLFAFACLLIFDMCERGVHLKNPFYSIWSTAFGTNLAYGFVILAAIAALLYFVFLVYLIVRVVATIKRKRASLITMQQNRRLRVEGIIYRFKFLMFVTFVCASLTIAGFIMEQIGEGQMRWGDYEESPMLNYTSAFMTGVFGMWNIYVLLLLAMYAPSHKEYHESEQVPTIELEDEDDLVLQANPMAETTEASLLTSLTKPATD